MNVSTTEVWDDVAGAAFGDADQEMLSNMNNGAITYF
jgi:hypothetical protein